MSEYVIQGQTLSGIADAIRAQLGTEQQYTPESMAAAIQSISGSSAEDAILTRQLSGEYINDRITSLGSNAMSEMVNLTKVHFANMLSLGFGSLQNSQRLTSVYVPLCKALNNQCLYGCIAIKYLSLPSAENINYAALQNCAALVALVLPGGTVCSLSSSANLTGTLIASGTGYIYVPDDLVDQYKVATNWATYADQIKGLSEIPAEVQEWLDQQGGASA